MAKLGWRVDECLFCKMAFDPELTISKFVHRISRKSRKQDIRLQICPCSVPDCNGYSLQDAYDQVGAFETIRLVMKYGPRISHSFAKRYPLEVNWPRTQYSQTPKILLIIDGTCFPNRSGSPRPFKDHFTARGHTRAPPSPEIAILPKALDT